MSEDLLSLENTAAPEVVSSFNSDRIKTGISLFYYEEVGVNYYFTPLVNITDQKSKILPLKLHEYIKIKKMVDGKEKDSFTTKVCRKSALIGEEVCEWCSHKDAFDKSGKKLNFARDVVMIPVYVFNRVGVIKTYKDKDGNEKEYPVNPVCFLVLKRGQKDANIANILEDDRTDDFLGSVYSTCKFPKELKKAPCVESQDSKKVAKKFQHLPEGITVPQDILDHWNSLTREEVRGLAANCYGLFDSHATKRLLELATKPDAVSEDTDDKPEESTVNAAAEMDG